MRGYGGGLELDTIISGAGRDTIELGNSTDVFYSGNASAIISDFFNPSDRIILNIEASLYSVVTDNYGMYTIQYRILSCRIVFKSYRKAFRSNRQY